MRRLLLILAVCLLAAGTARSANLGIMVGGETLGISATTKGVEFTWTGDSDGFRCLLTKSQFETFQGLVAQVHADPPTAPARRVGSAGKVTVHSVPGTDGKRWITLEFRTEKGKTRIEMGRSTLGSEELAGVRADLERPRARKRPSSLKEPAPGTPLAACARNLKDLAVAVEFYTLDHAGRAPASFAELRQYNVPQVPVCPVARRDTYTPGYRRWANDLCYEIQCSGGHHAAEGAPVGYPLYSWDIGVQIEPLRK